MSILGGVKRILQNCFPLVNSIVFRKFCLFEMFFFFFLPKENLCFVWEWTKNPKHDTFAQSHIGRMCGYHQQQIYIYLPGKYIDKGIPEFLEIHEGEGGMMTNTNHVKKTERTFEDRNGTIPQCLSPDQFHEDCDTIRDFSAENKKIKESFKSVVDIIEEAKDMYEAVNKSYSIASSGDAVLLSPACASFDLFENFEHRGSEFKKMVRSL